ncbi:MAG: hypothetical protein KIH04_02785 [Candidatus Freyarchaeota archaeon]|nr:hypothetical protein [Candidatus Jordarchaeia archaeon]
MFLMTERSSSMRKEKNFGEYFRGMGKVAELIARLSPDVLIVKSIGPRAISMFESMSVNVASCDALTLKDAINAYFEGAYSALTHAGTPATITRVEGEKNG